MLSFIDLIQKRVEVPFHEPQVCAVAGHEGGWRLTTVPHEQHLNLLFIALTSS